VFHLDSRFCHWIGSKSRAARLDQSHYFERFSLKEGAKINLRIRDLGYYAEPRNYSNEVLIEFYSL
jgi:hypothetical protein